jgi:uncharacterized membrane protein YkoI
MLQAIAIAEEASGVKAMAAHVKTEGQTTYYAIELVEDRGIRIALVDSSDGRLQE